MATFAFIPAPSFGEGAAVTAVATARQMQPTPQPTSEMPAATHMQSRSPAGFGLLTASLAAATAAGFKKRRGLRARRVQQSAGGQKAVPFLAEPQYWQWAKDIPGDNGFDPLNFWKGDMGSFANQDLDMRDAEIKHCRLAMLAAVHWPLAEIYHPQIAAALGMKNELTSSGLNPSLLNGGLQDPLLAGFLALAAFGAAVTDLSKVKGTEPGDYGFDPLGLRDFQPPVLPSLFKLEGRPWMAEAEVTHGRLAMVAITAFAVQEKISFLPLSQETPGLFGQA